MGLSRAALSGGGAVTRGGVSDPAGTVWGGRGSSDGRADTPGPRGRGYSLVRYSSCEERRETSYLLCL